MENLFERDDHMRREEIERAKKKIQCSMRV